MPGSQLDWSRVNVLISTPLGSKLIETVVHLDMISIPPGSSSIVSGPSPVPPPQELCLCNSAMWWCVWGCWHQHPPSSSLQHCPGLKLCWGQRWFKQLRPFPLPTHSCTSCCSANVCVWGLAWIGKMTRNQPKSWVDGFATMKVKHRIQHRGQDMSMKQ